MGLFEMIPDLNNTVELKRIIRDVDSQLGCGIALRLGYTITDVNLILKVMISRFQSLTPSMDVFLQ